VGFYTGKRGKKALLNGSFQGSKSVENPKDVRPGGGKNWLSSYFGLEKNMGGEGSRISTR